MSVIHGLGLRDCYVSRLSSLIVNGLRFQRRLFIETGSAVSPSAVISATPKILFYDASVRTMCVKSSFL